MMARSSGVAVEKLWQIESRFLRNITTSRNLYFITNNIKSIPYEHDTL